MKRITSLPFLTLFATACLLACTALFTSCQEDAADIVPIDNPRATRLSMPSVEEVSTILASSEKISFLVNYKHAFANQESLTLMMEALNGLTPQEYETYIRLDYKKTLAHLQADKAQAANRHAFLKAANKLSEQRFGRSFMALHGEPLTKVVKELRKHRDYDAWLNSHTLPQSEEALEGTSNSRIVTDFWGRDFWEHQIFVDLWPENDQDYFNRNYGNAAPYYYPNYIGKASLSGTGTLGVNNQEVYVFRATNVARDPDIIYVQAAFSAFFALYNSPLASARNGIGSIPCSSIIRSSNFEEIQVAVGVDEYIKFANSNEYIAYGITFQDLFRIVAY